MADRIHDAAVAAAGCAEGFDLASGTVAGFSRARGETPAAQAWRLAAADALAGLPLPDRVRHLWRYTDPHRLLPRRLWATEAPAAPDVRLPDGPAVLLQAGRAPWLNDAARACGLALDPLLADAADADLLGAAVPPQGGHFEALNAAAWNVGLRLRAPRGLVLAQPLRVLVAAAPGADLLPRLLIEAAAGASLTVVEEHLGGGREGVVVGVTEILLRAGAEVRHVLLQRWAEGQAGHLMQRAVLERDARFLGATASLGATIAKLDLGAVLAGEGARSELVGVTLPQGRQHLDHHTMHRHTSGRTWSNIDFKAAVGDRARSAYTGMIRIEQRAPVSEAYQENRNLLLSDRARADTIPELEILTDEVSCSHGATVAPVDPEQIFYLQSRGLARAEALHQVVRGFVEPTLRLVPEALREELSDLLQQRLAGLTRPPREA